ncbi:MAG: IS30 family transposase [Sphingomonas sp.]|jgi:IS30 family transposase|uniref:IS30 family transposase n=1 Tax=Sphingomonas sp. TaxID=28214 RepID=UPI00356B05C3
MSYSHLSYVERLEIADGQRAGLSLRAIARRLKRDPGTVSRELERNALPGYGRYDACAAFFGALARRSHARRGHRKLRPDTPLFAQVATHLREGWSPSQIAGRLRRMDPEDRRARACHETIYVALYALPRGELRRELLAWLRQGRQTRRPRSRGADRRGFVPDDLRIAERPEEIAERLIPGHWEGDFIKGAHNRSAVGTLVERTSRLVRIARMEGLDAVAARQGFESLFRQVPEPMRKTMTYDRGTEMARHAELTQNTGVKVYFADPYSPWQRASNENMNGLIRQYLPKGTDLSSFSQDDLDAIAYRLNSRPRKTLDFQTPYEVYHQLAETAASSAPTVALQN